MRRFLQAAALLAAAIAPIAAAPAQAPGGYYVATAAAAPGKPSLVTRSTPWRCDGATCVAARAPERPAILCQLVAQQLGTLSSFAAGGVAFDTPSLDKCNARAR